MMRDRRLHVPLARFALAGLLLAIPAVGTAAGPLAPRTAHAQEGEDGDRVVREAERLRNTLMISRMPPEDVLAIVQYVLSHRVEAADEILRRRLRDTNEGRLRAAEQIVVATLVGPERRLLTDVLERLRIERGSALDQRLDDVFLRYASRDVVASLVGIAGDAGRSLPLRREAVRSLGRSRNLDAAAPLLDLWGGPEPGLREEAATAFGTVLPGFTSYEQAAAAMASAAERGVPLTELLRRQVARLTEELARRERDRPAAGNREEVASLLALLDAVGDLDAVITHYLGSRNAALREAGARRLVDLPYTGATARTDRRRAGQACLALLPAERSETVELALIGTATAFADDLRGNVGQESIEALHRRVADHKRTSRAVQRATVRLLGRLEDPRSSLLLRARFEELDGADPDFRQELLDAIGRIPAEDLVDWLIGRGATEPHSKMLQKIVVMLGKHEQVSVIAFYEDLLGDPEQDVQVHNTVADALRSFWVYRQTRLARRVLLDVGITARDATVRKIAVQALGAPANSGDDRRSLNDESIAKLGGLLAEERDAEVRAAVVAAVFELVSDGLGEAGPTAERRITRELLPFMANPEDADVWKLYVERMVNRVVQLQAPERAVEAAEALEEEGLKIKAKDLLQAVVARRAGLWEGKESRGAVRKKLAEYLLGLGDPGGARDLATDLIQLAEKDPRPSDPLDAWNLLLARASRRSGAPEDLARAQRLLTDLLERLEEASTAPNAPEVTRPVVLLELARTLRERGDATLALDALDEIRKAEGVPPAVSGPADLLRPDVKAEAREEKERVFQLVDALGNENAADAERDLGAMGHRAARYLLDALNPSFDPKRQLLLLDAAGVLLGAKLRPASDASAALEAAREAARKQLVELIRKQWRTWPAR